MVAGDHLSARVTTDANGNVIGQQGHFPFGESWYAANTTTKYQFTSYERDSESGNDYAQARYHVNRLGRFSSPDPVGGSIGDPQSLNRYTYVRNMPTGLVDPSGMMIGCPNVAQNWKSTRDQAADGSGPFSDDDSDFDAAEPQSGCGAFGNGGGSCNIDGANVPCSLAGGTDPVTGSYMAEGVCPPEGCTGAVVTTQAGPPIPYQFVSTLEGGFLLYPGLSTDAIAFGLPTSWSDTFAAFTSAATDLAIAMEPGEINETGDHSLLGAKCDTDLALLNINHSQVFQGAINANFVNGIGNTTPLSDNYITAPNPDLRRLAGTVPGTVGSKIAEPGVVAVSQLGGSNIYLNPNLINAQDSRENLGTAFHEIVHNISGLTDSDIQRALGLSTSEPSRNISLRLLKDCF